VADSLELDWLVIGMKAHTSPRDVLIAASVVATAAAMVVCSGCNLHPQAQAATSASTEPPSSTSVTPAPAPAYNPPPSIAQDPKAFTTTGPLVADQQADIAAERNGRVVNIAVQIGDHVKTGQLLALLDDRALRMACDAQRARIAAAQAQVVDLEAEQKSVTADLRRADQMRTDKIISDEVWEHAKYKLDETIAEVARYRSEEAAAEADLNNAQLQLEQSRIVAPFNGVVGRSSVRPAQQVKAGDVLFWITAVAPLNVLFTVPESFMAEFSSGKTLELTTPDYPALHQTGRIVRVSPVVDPASGSVQVIGQVVRPSPLLKPGMSMQVRLAP
jgi:membrane fusion protein, multidrug efflux system